MPNKENTRTLVTFLLDRSGSMKSVQDDTIGAFNTYIDTLQDPNGAGDPNLIDFTFLQFDSMSIDKICVGVPVRNAVKLDRSNFVPRGSTPLIDAAYKTIKAVDASLGDKDRKVVICIQTDGQENCSAEYTWNDLNALIKEKTALGWQFVFMGCSIDAYDQGAKMGITRGSTVSYNGADSVATAAAFRATASNSRSFAAGLSENASYSAADKLGAGDAYDPDLNPIPVKRTRPVDLPKATTPKPVKRSIVDDIKL